MSERHLKSGYCTNVGFARAWLQDGQDINHSCLCVTIPVSVSPFLSPCHHSYLCVTIPVSESPFLSLCHHFCLRVTIPISALPFLSTCQHSCLCVSLTHIGFAWTATSATQSIRLTGAKLLLKVSLIRSLLSIFGMELGLWIEGLKIYNGV